MDSMATPVVSSLHQLSHEKKLSDYPLNPGCFIGILMLVYYDPLYNWVGIIPNIGVSCFDIAPCTPLISIPIHPLQTPKQLAACFSIAQSFPATSNLALFDNIIFWPIGRRGKKKTRIENCRKSTTAFFFTVDGTNIKESVVLIINIFV